VAEPTTICVLGAGSWGATLAGLLADNGHAVTLWEFDASAAKTLADTRRLKILPELKLPSTVKVTSQLADALKNCGVAVSAVPSQFVRSTMRAVAATHSLPPATLIVSVSKGLEENTLKRMSEVIQEELRWPGAQVLTLCGPSHAEEVCRRMPTATVVAGSHAKHVETIRTLFLQDNFRVYSAQDVIGAELAAALKNVYAIACGISDGLGFGDNTRAAILTRALNEMTRIGLKMNAQLLTFFSLAGMGDLIVTCISQHSRNHQLGEKIGKGASPAQALSEMTMVAEGYKTAPAAHQLAQQLGIDCPLIQETYEILYKGKNPRNSLHDLMKRETHNEWPAMLAGKDTP